MEQNCLWSSSEEVFEDAGNVPITSCLAAALQSVAPPVLLSPQNQLGLPLAEAHPCPGHGM